MCPLISVRCWFVKGSGRNVVTALHYGNVRAMNVQAAASDYPDHKPHAAATENRIFEIVQLLLAASLFEWWTLRGNVVSYLRF